MSASNDIQQMVREYILREFLPGVDASELSDTTPLISGGVLDSLATVKLVAALEETYGIEIQPHEASITHFNCVKDIAALVAAKRKA
ncbi:MAG TPA: acyl carrier protein [Gemmatimonadales bacterium]|nr:acyl carrier protein [Gemmatimonadales bacterium]